MTTTVETTGRTVNADGITTHYHDVGPSEGAPVLLLHGSGPGVSAHATWRLNMYALAEHGCRAELAHLVERS